MKSLKFVLVGLILLALAVVSHAAEGPAASSGAAEVHLFASPKEIKWGPAPPVVPKGAEAAVLDGDPFKDGSFYTLRLKMPDGYKIPPHWHPTDENVTVLSGTLGAGMGDKFDPAKGQLMKPEGSYRCRMACTTSHGPRGLRSVQVTGSGLSLSHT